MQIYEMIVSPICRGSKCLAFSNTQTFLSFSSPRLYRYFIFFFITLLPGRNVARLFLVARHMAFREITRAITLGHSTDTTDNTL